jgi:hypothetical protein
MSKTYELIRANSLEFTEIFEIISEEILQFIEI